MKEISVCEVCENRQLISVLNLGDHPMCDDLVPVGDERTCNEYPIELLFCETCKTVHQRFQVPKEHLFPQSYHYRSRFTADVLSGMKSLVDTWESKFGSLKEKVVLDIGCNDGSLLGYFREKGAVTLGIEPTGAAEDAKADGHETWKGYLNDQLATQVVEKYGQPDVVVFTNVFAHIEDLREVVRSLQVLVGPNTSIVIENHYLGSVLARGQFDTFYHEHPRTYSYTSFQYIARSLRLDLLDVEFPARYGGNIRVFMGHLGRGESPSQASETLLAEEAGFLEAFNALARKVETWRSTKGNALDALVAEHGPLQAKAFPGRAAILVKLLGLDTDMIVAAYEKPGSMKIGHYLPGTRIPIVSDEALFEVANEDAPIVNFAWHISREINEYLRASGCTRTIVDIISDDDF